MKLFDVKKMNLHVVVHEDLNWDKVLNNREKIDEAIIQQYNSPAKCPCGLEKTAASCPTMGEFEENDEHGSLPDCPERSGSTFIVGSIVSDRYSKEKQRCGSEFNRCYFL